MQTIGIQTKSTNEKAFQISTSIQINANAETVWKVLTDFDNYPEWNPFIKEIKGKSFEVGAKFFAQIDTMKFKPTVQIWDENKVFEWLGSLLFKGIFDGRHRFELIDNQDGSTTLIQSERFTGLLVPVFKKSLNTKTIKGFEMMNEALKKRVEG